MSRKDKGMSTVDMAICLLRRNETIADVGSTHKLFHRRRTLQSLGTLGDDYMVRERWTV